jgi:hypothetical protein
VAEAGRLGGKGQRPVVPQGFKKRQEVDPAWPPAVARDTCRKGALHALSAVMRVNCFGNQPIVPLVPQSPMITDTVTNPAVWTWDCGGRPCQKSAYRKLRRLLAHSIGSTAND